VIFSSTKKSSEWS